MNYDGNERRKHRIYRTRNTEYHLKDNVCVAVRDRQSNRFRPAHIALQLKLEGGVRIYDNGAMVPCLADPKPGDAIYFSHFTASGEERQIVTSRLEAIERPSKQDVASYPEWAA